MSKYARTFMFVGAAVLLMSVSAVSQVPQLISYQGRLTDSSGTPLNGTFDITFSLYEQSSGGIAFWSEEHIGLTITNGLFSVQLGSITPFGPPPPPLSGSGKAPQTKAQAAGDTWVGIAVGTDPEMTPRIQMTSVPFSFDASRAIWADSSWWTSHTDTSSYAFQAGVADTALYAFGSGFADTAWYATSVKDSSVIGSSILGGSIGLGHIGQNGATSGQVMKWNGSSWAVANDSVGPEAVAGPWAGDGVRVFLTDSTDRVGIGTSLPQVQLEVHGTALVTQNFAVGPNNVIAANNGMAIGSTHGVFGDYSSISGGVQNQTGDSAAHVGGGRENIAGGLYSFVGGGIYNKARGDYSVVSGGGGDLTSDSNYAGGSYSVVSGGRGNGAVGFGAHVGGGTDNTADGSRATVSGGVGNSALFANTTVAGGSGNKAEGSTSSVVGGQGNRASGGISFVGGGSFNTASGAHSVVVGGGGVHAADSNIAAGDLTFIGGGRGNRASDSGDVVVGGISNSAVGRYSNVGGGLYNFAGSKYATVSGGHYDSATADFAVIGGGQLNDASANYATIAGGHNNHATGIMTFVGSGHANNAAGELSVVAGGWGNLASGDSSFIGGGVNNGTTGDLSTVGGGYNNATVGKYSTIGGGNNNFATDTGATIGGGFWNRARGKYATVAGGGGPTAGDSNSANGAYAAVGGGHRNFANGFSATIPGGMQNYASGDYSFAAGRRAMASHNGAFVWGDDSNAFFESTAPNQFLIRAGGGVGIGTNNPGAQLGVVATTGGAAKFSNSGSGGQRTLTVSNSVGNAASFYSQVPSPGFVSQYTLYARGGGTQSGGFFSSDSGIGLIAQSMDTGNAFWGWAFGSGYSGYFTGGGGVKVVGNICATGTIGVCSDRRYKKEIRPLEGALGAVGRLQGVHFDWRRDEFPDLDFGKGRQIGFIAQEVREVLPELVSEDREGYLSVDYARVTPLLVEAVKELDRKTQELSKQSQRVDQLEKELAQLKAVIASRLPALGEVKLSRK